MKLLKYILIAIVFAATAGEAFGQVKVLSGKVTEMFGATAEPMVGVNVNILNSQNRSLGGTITNMDGIYNLKVPNENNLTIVFSYIGMKTQRIKYNGQTKLNITMKDDTQSINEVVISGKRIERNDMGISSREQSSATQKVNMEDLVAIAPVTSIEDALQGQLGGVDIVLGGGDPGARASIQIRGGSTLNANSEPLIVVDGVPYPAEIDDNTDFSTINNDDLGALLNISPQDIESIEVLKDAAATAVWMFTPGFSRVGSFVGLADNILSNKSKRKTPALNPSKPAKAVSTKLSLMTCEMMSKGLAPKALRTPISLVRSFTVTIMILLIPIIPDSKVPMPTSQTKMSIPVNSRLNVLNCAAILTTPIA